MCGRRRQGICDLLVTPLALDARLDRIATEMRLRASGGGKKEGGRRDRGDWRRVWLTAGRRRQEGREYGMSMVSMLT